MKVIFAESHNLDRPDPLGSHHYIRHFHEAGWDPLWLGPAVSPMHLFKPDRLNRDRFRIWREGGRKVEGIDWLVPFTALFYYRAPLLDSLYAGRNQYRFCLPPLKGQLERRGFAKTDLLWCAGPAAYSLLDLVPHRLSCLRIADRLDRFSRIPASVNRLQAELIGRVDLVFATSRSLQKWAARHRDGGVYYLPNGVSDIFFTEYPEPPDDFPRTDAPVAVYTGTVDERFDLQALQLAVRQAREVHFLVIGPVTANKLIPGLEELKGEANFTLLGPKRYSLIPAYLGKCSAGLIPFVESRLTEAVNPIKYYEYLACGLPVAASPLPELTGMGGPLYPYRRAEDLAEAVRLAVKAGGKEKAENREYAAGQTWQSRFRDAEALIKAALERKA